MSKKRLPAYLSHSYRSDDREVNEFFWHLLWDGGFTGSVDRKSGVFSAPHVEMLISNSTCFVGVVTERPTQPWYRCSPFVVYEHGLAVRARKERLVFVETGVSARSFRDNTTTCTFDREHLRDDIDTFRTHIESLRKRTGKPEPRHPLLGKVGLLLKPTSPEMSRLRSLVDGHGYEALVVEPNPNLVEFTYLLNEFDFVILDATHGVLPTWVHPFVLGTFKPAIALLNLEASASTEISPLLSANIQPGIPSADGPVVMWRQLDQLEESVDRHVLRLRAGRRLHFVTREQGDVYFRSQGRQTKRVFLSNFNDANELARAISGKLDERGVTHFHYKYHNTIQLGGHWQSALEAEIRDSDLFVALITPDYWHSEWAKKELETASELARGGALDVVPYFIEGDIVEMEQGRDMREMSFDERVGTIVKDIDNLMITQDDTEEAAPKPHSLPTTKAKGGRNLSKAVDVAIVTIIPEEYAAVLRHVKNAQRPDALGRTRNRHAWQTGFIESQGEQPYSVVVAMAGSAGTNNALNVVRNTVKQFRPHYVLIVGVAGGLLSAEELALPVDQRPLAKGDVVASSVIYGYEYGKIDGTFIPRHDLTYQVDASLLTAAQALPIVFPKWSGEVQISPPDPTSVPTVHAAPVASGDKVVDDPSNEFFAEVWRSWPKLKAVEMEGAGAAAAIRDLVESGTSVGLAMIRGISDIPTPSSQRPQGTPMAVSTQTAERDAWKTYAAETAAVFACQLISRSWPLAPRSSRA